jgi:hypothetical protein
MRGLVAAGICVAEGDREGREDWTGGRLRTVLVIGGGGLKNLTRGRWEDGGEVVEA